MSPPECGVQFLSAHYSLDPDVALREHLDSPCTGLMGKKHQLMFLANDDVETPTSLVGKKIAPIWVDADG